MKIEIFATDIMLLPDGYALAEKDVHFVMLRDDIEIISGNEKELSEGVKEFEVIARDHKFKWEFTGSVHVKYSTPAEFTRLVFKVKGSIVKNHIKKK